MNPLFKERRGKSDMPYIRTKNFIHDSKDVVVVNENGTLVVLRGIDKDFVERTRGKTWNTGTNVVLAQADTIEELCDEFRGVWTNYCEDGKDAHEEYHYDKEKNVFYDDFEELTHKEAIEKFDIFYGAIWTDRGLIYVAIMNDFGELALLW